MKYWLDTEFSERGSDYPINLISIGVVSEDGREFYAQNCDTWRADCNEWVQSNVIPQLTPCPSGNSHSRHWGQCSTSGCPWMDLGQIKEALITFLGNKPRIWGYYSDYDWVVFCQIFGSMSELPKGFPMYCRDIKQWADTLGNPRLPAKPEVEHHALLDAKWCRDAYEFLEELQRSNLPSVTI